MCHLHRTSQWSTHLFSWIFLHLLVCESFSNGAMMTPTPKESVKDPVYETPSGLCPPLYTFTHTHRRALCQRTFGGPRNWTDADRVCRQDKANIAAIAFGGVVPRNSADESSWWINWKQRDVSVKSPVGRWGHLTTSIGLGEWYRETIYGQDGAEPVRRENVLKEILAVEFGDEDLFEFLGVSEASINDRGLDPTGRGLCLAVRKRLTKLVLDTVDCSAAHPFTCELGVRALQESVITILRTTNGTKEPTRGIEGSPNGDTMLFYGDKKRLQLHPWEQLTVTERRILSQSVPATALSEALLPYSNICDRQFPSDALQKIQLPRHGNLLSWSTTLVEHPLGRTCYLSLDGPFSSSEANFQTALTTTCRTLNATLIKSLTFGQQYYSRYVWPLASPESGSQVRWIDAQRTRGTQGAVELSRNPTVNWKWSNNVSLSVETSGWIRSESLSPDNNCVTEQTYQPSNNQTNEFTSQLVPWNDAACNGSAAVVCQKDLPDDDQPLPRTPVITFTEVSKVDEVVENFLAGHPVDGETAAPLGRCTTDVGTLLNFRSVRFFGPNFTAADRPGTAALYPLEALREMNNDGDFGEGNYGGREERGRPNGYANSKSLFELVNVSCYLKFKEVSCQPLESKVTMIAGKVDFSIPVPITTLWRTVVGLSGYYHCSMLLRETRQWHHSPPVRMTGSGIDFAFRLHTERLHGEQDAEVIRRTANRITIAFRNWLQLQGTQMDREDITGPPSNLQRGAVVLSIQRRDFRDDALSGHIVFHLVEPSTFGGLPKREKPGVSISEAYQNSSVPLPVKPRMIMAFSAGEIKQLRQFVAFMNNQSTFATERETVGQGDQTRVPWLKQTGGCPAATRRYPNGVFRWASVQIYQGASSGRSIEFCPEDDFRRLCVGNFDIGYTLILPETPCSVAPPPQSWITDYLIGVVFDKPPLNNEALKAAATHVSDLLVNQTGKLTVTDLNYLGVFLMMSAEGSTNCTQDLFRSLIGIISQASHAPTSELQRAQSYCGTSNKFMTALDELARNVDLGPTDRNATLTVETPALTVQTDQIVYHEGPDGGPSGPSGPGGPSDPSDPSSPGGPNGPSGPSDPAGPDEYVSNGYYASGSAGSAGQRPAIGAPDEMNRVSDAVEASIILPGSLFRPPPRGSAPGIQGFPAFGGAYARSDVIRCHYIVIRDTAMLRVNNNSLVNIESSLDPSPSDAPSSLVPKPRQRIGSWIIGASFGAQVVMNLTEPVTITVKLDRYDPKENHSCVFWNTSAADKMGAWETTGCTLVGYGNGQAICQCNHLTSFAVLVDFYPTDDLIVLALPDFLDTLTMTALVLSIIGLIFTICLLLSSRKISRSTLKKRLSRNEFVVLNLSIALLLVYVIFLTGIDKVNPRGGCIVVGCLIHYFFLVTFFWQASEGFLLYNAFVNTVSAFSLSYFRVKAATLSWGIPVVIVGIVLIIDPDYYVGENVCWLQKSAPFFSTFIAPICLMLLSNVIIFSLVIRELSCAERLNIRSTRNKEDLITEFRRCLSLFFLLGLPWLLLTLNAFRSTAHGQLVLHILIIIVCGSQGLAIFVVEVYGMRKDLRDAVLSYSKKSAYSSTSDMSPVIGSISNRSSSSAEVELKDKKASVARRT